VSATESALEPIKTAHLFSKLEDRLVQLLAGLTHEEWARPTVSPRWNVKDVAGHLLDTEMRLLSMARDRHFSEAPGDESDAALVAFVDSLNREGVHYFRRVSPSVLTTLIASMAKPLSDYFTSLDPSAPAPFGVSWAGERVSTNWFNTAREFTERWHHQQQIRLAVGKPGIMLREFYHPVLDCFMRALPHSYREVRAVEGTMLQVSVFGDCGGDWYLHRDADRWHLLLLPAGEKVAQVTIPQDIAWRLFTRGIDRDEATAQIEVQGDVRLGLHILSTLAIVGVPR
jgi:uncharacterized protein (TIGR03083 family)